MQTLIFLVFSTGIRVQLKEGNMTRNLIVLPDKEVRKTNKLTKQYDLYARAKKF